MQELSFLSENDKDWAMRSRDRPAPEVDVIDLSMLFALSIVVSAARVKQLHDASFCTCRDVDPDRARQQPS
jgi:hypothetical protein